MRAPAGLADRRHVDEAEEGSEGLRFALEEQEEQTEQTWGSCRLARRFMTVENLM